jgi:hypothetical protein
LYSVTIHATRRLMLLGYSPSSRFRDIFSPQYPEDRSWSCNQHSVFHLPFCNPLRSHSGSTLMFLRQSSLRYHILALAPLSGSVEPLRVDSNSLLLKH